MKRLIINKEETIYDKFDGEYIFVNMDTGKYYSMKGNSGLVLNELEEGTTLDKIVSLFDATEEYNQEIIYQEVKGFITKLVALNVVIEKEIPQQGLQKTLLERTTTPFAGLTIEVYNDMEEVIKIDPIHNIADIEKGVR